MILRLIKNLFREVRNYPTYNRIPYILRKVGNITNIFNMSSLEKLHFDKWRVLGDGALTRSKQNNDFLFRFVVIEFE